MNGPLLVVGLACIAFGVFALVNRDAMWSLTEWSNSLRGLQSERTDTWEQGNGCTGFGMIAFGVAFLVFSVLSG